MRSGLLLFACFVTVAHADQLTLKNGDRVTGAIVKKDDKSITIKSDAFGVITAPWEQVTAITAEKPVTVVLKDGKSVEGTIATADSKLQVATQGAKLSVDPADVQTIRNPEEQRTYEKYLHPSWTELWTATGTLSLAGAVGNARTQTFTTSATAIRETRHDKATISFAAVDASATTSGVNAETARAVRGGVAYDHNVSPRLFVGGFNTYEYDRFQNLDLRFTAGGGLGVHAVKKEHATLDLTAGADYSHESFSTGVHRASGELYWGDDYNLQLTKAVSLVQAFRMFNNLSDTGQYRINFDLRLATTLTKWLTWNAAASDRYLSNPLPGRKTNDFLYSTGIGVSFK
ncbi:MAG TPA: DUF481 domain-containing protein [Candidatus Acidoferrales bacterium]|nr:DUF481 domain-containing protein [Candidatus Acidoferrales bacterium]